jgi:murein DD-endopeptidase MepM/ murein hydrolase activator NlpD
MPLPIKNGRISTPYKKPGKNWSKGYHTGLDFACKIGTPVLSVTDGVVEKANWGAAYGTQVIIRCKEGWIIYAHLNAARVKPGQSVKVGQLIGESGNSGTNTTGAHLHMELRDHKRWSEGKDLDPKELLK